jgi:hypothetical protein
MKKIVIASALALTCAASAFAGDVSVSTIRDYAVEKNGFAVGTTVAGLAVTASHVENTYNRFSVGKEFQLTKIGPVALSAGGGVVYQDTHVGENGYGLTVGAKATMPITKTVSLVAGVDRFMGQDRIKASNGNVGTVGLNIKF